MYYIYFPYVLILSVAMAILCHKQEKTLWWAVVVLFAPVTTPYFIVKSEKQPPGKWIALFIFTFLIVLGVEGFIWFTQYKQNQFNKLNPVDRVAVRLTRVIEANVAEMNEIMGALDIRNTVASGKKEIVTSKASIKRAKILIRQSQKVTRQFIIFVTDYGPYFQKTRQNWILQLRNFYKNKHMVKYYTSTQQYLDEFERLLNYTQAHFEQIKARKSGEIQNYDQYFIRYRHGLNIYQRYSDERMKVQIPLVKKYPEVKKYLPARAQTKAVSILD